MGNAVLGSRRVLLNALLSTDWVAVDSDRHRDTRMTVSKDMNMWVQVVTHTYPCCCIETYELQDLTRLA